VIELCVGEAFEEISNDKYFVNPAKSESFTELLGVLKRRNISIKTIIYGWSANSNAKEFVFSNEELAVNFFGPINFIKAVLRDGELKDKKFILLTQALHSVLGNERIHYSQSLALGISKVLPQEYSVSCFTIDIAPDDPVSTTADRIIEEIVDDSRKTVVAIRNNRRWLPDFERNRKAMELPTILKRNGAYLITGGLGNVGFILAKYLSSQYEATLILTGRRKIEGASQDELWVQRINELKKTNTNIYYYHVDVTDKDAFDSLTKRIELTTGPINGIIHAAGVIDFDYFELVEDITEKNSISILSPKVKGIMNLYEIFKNRQLDFVWVTSSISSVLGGLTFGAYTSANLFLEHFIASKPELTNWKCIGLGEMAFEEKEILNERAQKRRAMVPEEITRLFEWHIHPAHRSVCFETVDSLLNRIHKAYDSKKDVYLDDSLQSSGIAKVERPMLSSIYIAPESKTEKRITDLFEAFFGIQQVGIEDNFFELGGDSLKAMILLKRINKDFSITIPLKDFFKLQNIREVACEIDERAWIESESKKPFQSVI
jgi:polyketide synthase PksN